MCKRCGISIGRHSSTNISLYDSATDSYGGVSSSRQSLSSILLAVFFIGRRDHDGNIYGRVTVIVISVLFAGREATEYEMF